MRKLTNVSLAALLLAALLSAACSRDQGTSDEGRNVSEAEFSVAEARQYFESAASAGAQTRAGEEAGFDETEVLAPGCVTPDWMRAAVREAGPLYSAEVVFESEYDYRSLQYDERGDSWLVPMPRDLVVLKDPRSGEMDTYVRYLVPDLAYAALADRDDRPGFSGLLLYASLSGFPVAVGKWRDGVLQNSVSLAGPDAATAEKLDKMIEILGNVYAARMRTAPRTRAADSLGQGIPIEEVVVVGRAPAKVKEDLGPDYPDFGVVEPSVEEFIFDGSGGGSSMSDLWEGPKRSYGRNENLKISNSQVEKILDDFYNDCMGQILIGSLKGTIVIETGYFTSSTTHRDPLLWDNYWIKMGRGLSDISLMEELIHVYQLQQGADWKTEKLNCEIEAKLGWYMYRQRIGKQEDFGNKLGGKDGNKSFEELCVFIGNGDFESQNFVAVYELAVKSLRTIRGYSNEEYYPVDPTKMDFSRLLNLMKDCLKTQNR